MINLSTILFKYSTLKPTPQELMDASKKFNVITQNYFNDLTNLLTEFLEIKNAQSLVELNSIFLKVSKKATVLLRQQPKQDHICTTETLAQMKSVIEDVSTACFNASYAYTRLSDCNKKEMLKKSLSDVILEKIKLISDVITITREYKGTFLQHTDQSYHPLCCAIRGQCFGVNIDWAHALITSPPQKKAVQTFRFSRFCTVLDSFNTNKIALTSPSALNWLNQYALLGEQDSIPPASIHYHFKAGKLLSPPDPASNKLACEGRIVASAAFALLGKEKANVSIIEIALNNKIPEKEAHIVGVAKIRISESQNNYLLRLRDSEFGEFEFKCEKEFTEWLQQFFLLMKYNVNYQDFTLRMLNPVFESKLFQELRASIPKQRRNNIDKHAALRRPPAVLSSKLAHTKVKLRSSAEKQDEKQSAKQYVKK